MKYEVNKLPDFYSVRNFEQIDYSFAGMEDKKCYCFFDNGFNSNIIEANKRDIKFIWDGFILFVDKNISLNDIRNGINLYNARLVALQRTNLLGEKFNNNDVKNYIISKLNQFHILYELMSDKREVTGYPARSDLWSTRDISVLLDAVDCVGDGQAFYFREPNFSFEITFDKTNIPTLKYSHMGAIVLRGENSNAISRLICNDENLQNYLNSLVGSNTIYSDIEKRYLSGIPISEIKDEPKKI